MSKQDFETINSDALVTATGGTDLSNHQAYKLTQSIGALTNTLNGNGPNGANSQQAQTMQLFEVMAIAKMANRPSWA